MAISRKDTLCVGPNRKKSGYGAAVKRVYKRTENVQPKKPSNRRGRITGQAKFARELIKEVVGFSPYEKRIMEFLKNDREKRALKFAKKRIGGHRRAKRKRDDLMSIVKAVRTK